MYVAHKVARAGEVVVSQFECAVGRIVFKLIEARQRGGQIVGKCYGTQGVVVPFCVRAEGVLVGYEFRIREYELQLKLMIYWTLQVARDSVINCLEIPRGIDVDEAIDAIHERLKGLRPVGLL